MALSLGPEEILQLIHHIVLPPQLPQKEDDASDLIFVDITLAALKDFRTSLGRPCEAIDDAIHLLVQLKGYQGANGAADEVGLHRAFTSLQPGRTMAVKVSAQNAAVMVTHQGSRLLFEGYELSPQNKAVMAAKGRLIRNFPAVAVTLDSRLLGEGDFTRSITKTLATMAHQRVPEMLPKSKKANQAHEEDRDTSSPAVVTEMLFGMLRGLGKPSAEADGVSKRMREEVLWKDARRPWRRSSMWLLIRVALQLTIARRQDGSDFLYKNAMLFLMARLLSSGLQAELPSDILHAMTSKIDRRRQKLLSTASLQDPVRHLVERQLRETHAVLSRRWKSVQSSSTRNVQESVRSLRSLDFLNDTFVSLPHVDQYIADAKSRQSSTSGLNFQPQTGLLQISKDRLPPLSERPDDAYAVPNLRQFEKFVDKDLNKWMADHDSNTICRALCEGIKSYHSVASVVYGNNPEGVSLMILTLMEMWVACDRAAAQCTLLQDYTIGFEVPIAILQNLLLPFSQEMDRLAEVEQYIASRSTARLSHARLFDIDSVDGFPNRYYDTSPSHAKLHKDILTQADNDRKAKIDELQHKQSEYRRLNALASSRSCEYITNVIDSWCDPPETETVHSSSCQKCAYVAQRDALVIQVFEWPLPERQVRAKAVVFELALPEWFAHWRDARLYMLHQVFKGTRPSRNISASYRLSSNDPHLTKRFSSARNRLDLLSETKPVVVTHYRAKPVATETESSICTSNGLSYKYYDSGTASYLVDLTYSNQIERACTFKLPDNVQIMQKFLMRTAEAPDGVAPNSVIANQHECPATMSLEEFKELASIPLGHRIQWSNILLQLRMPSVDFKKLETSLFVLQCIYQAGPPSSDSDSSSIREAHKILLDGTLARLVVEALETALRRIKENWESAQALSTFIAIAARVLSLNGLSPNTSLNCACLAFLSKARAVAVDWLHNLREKAFAAGGDHDARTAFVAKSIEVALICCSTFDVDDEYLDLVLSGSDASFLISASIVIQEGLHSRAFQQPHISRLNVRVRRLLHRGCILLSRNTSAIDTAVLKAWSAYQPGTAAWSLLADHWLSTKTAAAAASSGSAHVHYNILTGELLVNGLPLDQPPKSYRDQALFRTLFGDATVEVMPASEPGFQFSTKRAFAKGSVLLGIHGDHLRVRASGPDGTFETVPNSMLKDKYPAHFVNDFVLWYKEADGLIELRPVKDPWNSKTAIKWTLSRSTQSATPAAPWRLERSGVHALGLASNTAKAIEQILQPLADRQHIHCLLQPDTSLLVELPLLRIGFTLQHGLSDLVSREYRSMAVDADQSLGTFVGFANKLMLKPRQGGQRLALLLASDLIYRKEQSHVHVSVQSRSQSTVHAVKIDDSLHRLLDNNDLDCKLYLAYLHALTSGCLPDPVTLKTGTEQALTILRSQGVASFSQLSQENVEMLQRIARLSPGRCYYPSYERVMQSVDWDSRLSFMAQHEDLSTVVSTLLRQSEAVKLFYPDVELRFARPKEIEEHLRSRDSIRTATFRTAGFGAENHTTAYDAKYDARDTGGESTRAKNVATLSTLFLNGQATLHWDSPTASNLWSLMTVAQNVQGLHMEIKSSDLRYDEALLRNGFASCIKRLPALLRWLKDQQTSPRSKFTVLVWLSTLAFSTEGDITVVQLLAICFKSPRFDTIDSTAVSFSPPRGRSSSHSQLKHILDNNCKPFDWCPEFNLPRNVNEKKDPYYRRRLSAWKNAKNDVVSQMVNRFLTQWPCASPSIPNVAKADNYLSMEYVRTAVRDIFQAWYDNSMLYDFLAGLERFMKGIAVKQVILPNLIKPKFLSQPSQKGFLSEADLFLQTPPTLPSPTKAMTLSQVTEARPDEMTAAVREPRLRALVDRMHLVEGQTKYEHDYIEDLRASLEALISKRSSGQAFANSADVQSATSFSDLRLIGDGIDDLPAYLRICEDHVKVLYQALADSLASSNQAAVAREIGHLPRMSPAFLLKQLARDRWPLLSSEWQKCVVEYGLALTALQRANRLVTLAEANRVEDLAAELRNVGHANWLPSQHPETVLIEAESGIMVREVQEQIAAEMRDAKSGRNAVMQLNMGEGKSSVIVPIVATNLADGSQLVRVVVAKPQSKQMAQMLISKLGGLVGRRVYHMPFARALQPTRTDMAIISSMLRECMANGGILLVQPEHILSFKLMAPETVLGNRKDVAKSVLATQSFLDRHSRDIVDESDENFSPKFELIYTMGTQRLVEWSPGRWFLMQQVFELVKRIAPAVARELSSDLEVIAGVAGSFPRTRILQPDGGDQLMSQIAKYICEHGLDSFAIGRQSSHIRVAVYNYITMATPSAADIALVESSRMWTESNQPQLLVLRGLFADGVLNFVLGQKRWRVNYGLAERNPPIKVAVPYRAKDTPAPRSEFSHPDVVIALTLLSYYYGGLANDELFAAFSHLTESDQADITYQEWVRDSSFLPSAFTTLKGINLKDRSQCINEIFPALRYGKSVVDYFVSHMVFPKEMKEFPHKLSASGWDLGKSRERLTTGFSGTIDSRHVLPLDVEHLELAEQKHTNALVLEYLLQKGNGVRLMPANTQKATDADRLLSFVLQLEPPVQVILDVGAQILELDNLQMAKAWLNLHDLSKEAVVFVNEADEICVVDRSGQVDRLQTSSYQSRLDACLVFLDEAHTRGIDLVLPVNYRAAVTLGPRLTKDRLVQACMRMRKLGKGQTVVFCVSEEIQAKIRDVLALDRFVDITVSDILEWSMRETLADLRRNVPLWAVQGQRFARQEKIWKAAQTENGEAMLTQEDADKLLEPEARSLEDRYRPCEAPEPAEIFANDDSWETQQILDRCEAFGITQFKSSALQEEQERELSPEMEQERQIQRAQLAKPLQHQLHTDVEKFALTGEVVVGSSAYESVFASLRHTTAGKAFPVAELAGNNLLLATRDFTQTVAKTGTGFVSDTFLRSVQWIITSRRGTGVIDKLRGTNVVDKVMIISPYEANQLFQRMQSSKNTTLHVYRARVNSGYAALDTLDFHTLPTSRTAPSLPRQLAVQLNLFAGQLYIGSHGDYLDMCKFLGLLPQVITDEMEKEGWQVDANGFILSDNEGRLGGESKLTKSPVEFLKSLITYRRNGDGFSRSDMGKLLAGGLFKAEDFE